MTEQLEQNQDPIIQKAKENLNLTQKQAEHFANEAPFPLMPNNGPCN